jgi:integrase
LTRSDAKKWQARAELRRVPESIGTRTVQDAVAAWLADRRVVCARRTWETYASPMKDFCGMFGSARVDRLTRDHAERWRDALSKTRAPATVRIYGKALKMLARYCSGRRWCPGPFTDGMALPRVKRKVPAWLDEQQTAALLTELQATDKELYLCALFACRAGLRRNEIRMLRWSDVDATTMTLRVNETKSVTRLIPMHGELGSALTTWPQQGEYVFDAMRRGKVGDHRSSALGKAMNAWLKAHGYGITIHGLRHSFASQLAAAGASEAEIRDLLGHTSIEITRLYTHVRDLQKRSHVLSLGQNPASPSPPVRSAFAPVADPLHSASTSPR